MISQHVAEVETTVWPMDHIWAAGRLRDFVLKIDHLTHLDSLSLGERVAAAPQFQDTADELLTLDPVIRDLMNAARPGLGDYVTLNESPFAHPSETYWSTEVKPCALQAIGIHELGEEARCRMRPDSPDLAADQLHPWVWEAAAPMWHAGSTQAAVLAAAQSVNARLQQKLDRYDCSDAGLCREAFSRDDPAPGRPRLRFAGDRTSDTWRSRQNGGVQFGAGCFEGLRNPAAHEHELRLPEQIALEQLAAFSVLARWIEQCAVRRANGVEEIAVGTDSLGGART
jgi:hypothetical protein